MNDIKEYEKFADTTEYLIISKDLIENMYNQFIDFTHNYPLIIISDENTRKAAGSSFIDFCNKNNILIEAEHIFSAEPELTSEYKNIETIIEILKKSDAVPVAIGSGTINDLVKRASYEVGRKYAVIATAASVDGYASDGAAILYKGLKQTLPCSAPRFIAADTEVLKNAPFEMASSGYADLIAKNPAGADWIIADFVKEDPIVPEVWELIQDNLISWVSEPEKLKEKDNKAFSDVFKGLTVSGFAMQYMKRSRPVSGAEHLMSHIWEMENHTYKGKHISHGFKVGIGSLASIALMETLMIRGISREDIDKVVDKWPSVEDRCKSVTERFNHMSSLSDLLNTNKEKYISREILSERLQLISENWTEFCSKLKKHLIPYGEYREKLKQAGCPVTPEEIGLTRDRVIDTYFSAQMIRNRYTILDLAYETGLLEDCSREILNSHEYFY